MPCVYLYQQLFGLLILNIYIYIEEANLNIGSWKIYQQSFDLLILNVYVYTEEANSNLDLWRM